MDLLLTVLISCAAAAVLAIGGALAWTGGRTRLRAIAAPQRGGPHLRDVTRPDPARLTLSALRADIGGGEASQALAAMLAVNPPDRQRVIEFAAQLAHVLASDQRSLLYLAVRFTGTPAGRLFAELAETSRHAADMLVLFAEAVGTDKAELPARAPLPGCLAYPAFTAWLALNASAEDAALAMAVVGASWEENLAAVAAVIRANPALKIDDRASAFFDIAAPAGSRLGEQALAVVEDGRKHGRMPVLAQRYARLLGAYQRMFWRTLAETTPVPGADPAVSATT